ncbi:hypothetical protein ACP70R_006206 [Stipagrostis hirtigluma subsp. patula]
MSRPLGHGSSGGAATGVWPSSPWLAVAAVALLVWVVSLLVLLSALWGRRGWGNGDEGDVEAPPHDLVELGGAFTGGGGAPGGAGLRPRRRGLWWR